MNLESAAHFIGKDGFNWWLGQIENDGSTPDDYDFTGKVKVRIVGYHNPDTTILPTKDLPWASCLMPVTQAQRGGIGSIHQLQISSWVVGFFMDGASAQIPVIMGTISDENPKGVYKKTGEKGKAFQTLLPPDYKPQKHGETGGSTVGGTASTVSESSTGTKAPPNTGETPPAEEGETTTSTVNPRGEAAKQTDIMKAADAKRCYTVSVSNGKCGQASDVKIKGAMAEFLKYARGIEKNEIGEFINSATGEVEDFAAEVEKYTSRIGKFMDGIMGNVKGVVLKETEKFIQEQMDKINIPDPDILDPLKEQLKSVSDLIKCLFKQIAGDILGTISGMLMDLVEQALDSALCLAQDVFMDLFGGVIDSLLGAIESALGILQGVLGAIKGAAAMIQGLMANVLDLIDMICGGDLSCALGLSTFETCHGPKESEGDKTKKQQSQYGDAAKKELAGGKTRVVGNGKPNSRGYVPVTKIVDGVEKKMGFNTKTGEYAEVGAAGTGISDQSFEKGKSLIEKFDSVYPIRDSDGNIQMSTLNCSPSNLNKKPCFPELIFDNAQSTTFIKALPIIDDMGAIVGAFMRKKGSNISTTARVRAMFSCNEPEGRGFIGKPIVKNGKIESIAIKKTGVGYGLDPDTSTCPTEQRIFLVPNVELADYVDEGGYLFPQDDPNNPILQVLEFNYNNTGYIGLATLDKTEAIPEGLKLQNANGDYKFTLNPVDSFFDLAIPENTTAIYAGCADLIPTLAELIPDNVGKGYTKPVIKVGDEEIGDAETDKDGRITRINVTKKTIGYIRPRVVDDTGFGAELIPTYEFVGPEKLKSLYAVNTYIDCVSHPQQLVGWVNGQPYYGPFHTHMGRKMVGAVHTDEPHEYIYDSKAESLGQGVTVTVESDYYSSSTPTNVINTSTSTENTTPTTTNVVDPGGSSPTPTPTPSPSPSPTYNPPNSGGSGGSSGGGGYGY